MPSPSLSTDEFHSKLQTLASLHERMKIAYHELKSQINAGLLESNEVFASLAIPLMKLVGLKTKEMAQEGRFSSIIIDSSFSHGPESQSSDSRRGGDQDYHNAASEVLLDNLGKHRLSLHKYFQQAIYSIVSVRSQNKDTFSITVKLLRAIFNNVNTVLGSLEGGVDNLIQGLAEKMCDPMVEYAKGLADDLKNGTSRQLLAMVKEMEQMMRKGKLELEDARKKVSVAEEGKIEAICKLKAIEGSVKRMKQQLYLPEPQKRHACSGGPAAPHKFSGMDDEQAKDDKLLWNLLNKKRKGNVQTSPMGPEGLLWTNAYNNRSVRPSLEHTRVKRSCRGVHGPKTPNLDKTWIPLGSSPSLAIQSGLRPSLASRTRACGLSTPDYFGNNRLLQPGDCHK